MITPPTRGESAKWLFDLAKALASAPRVRTGDSLLLEGARYVQISDVLASDLAVKLEVIARGLSLEEAPAAPGGAPAQ